MTIYLGVVTNYQVLTGRETQVFDLFKIAPLLNGRRFGHIDRAVLTEHFFSHRTVKRVTPFRYSELWTCYACGVKKYKVNLTSGNYDYMYAYLALSILLGN